MATGAGASSSQLRDTSPTRQRTYPMPMSVQHMRVSNKATALRELHRSQRMHMEKLRNMKPGIDMKRPEQPKFLQYNAKRVQMEKERNLTIERENKILLGKMYSIMNSEPAYKTTQHKTISLNMSIRKQEYDRIARENQVRTFFPALGVREGLRSHVAGRRMHLAHTACPLPITRRARCP